MLLAEHADGHHLQQLPRVQLLHHHQRRQGARQGAQQALCPHHVCTAHGGNCCSARSPSGLLRRQWLLLCTTECFTALWEECLNSRKEMVQLQLESGVCDHGLATKYTPAKRSLLITEVAIRVAAMRVGVCAHSR